MRLKVNDRARIVGDNTSGHAFKNGDTVIITEVHTKNYRARLEGYTSQWYVVPEELVLITPEESSGLAALRDKVRDLEKEVAHWKGVVTERDTVLDYAFGYLQDGDPVGFGKVHGFWDGLGAQS